MKLIDILVRELPNLGGWPPGSESLYQNAKGHLVGVQGCIVSPVDIELGVVAEDTHRSVTREQYEAALTASKPEWDGVGLPPVGCECEFKANDDGWGIGTVLCVGKNRIFWLCHEDGDEYTSEVNPQEFRPIRSEADKKKEKVVDEIMSWMHYAGRAEVELIYDAIKSGKIVID